MAKKTLVYIDHSFHKKTRSTFFLRDVLSKDFEVTNLWDDSWRGEEPILIDQINNLNCDYILFFQVLPSIAELKEIKHKVIWVPMYDSCFVFSDAFWLELSTIPIKIISFSTTLSDKMIKFGLDVLDVKYYFDPKIFKKKYPNNVNDSGASVFFWQRGPIKFNKIKKVLGDLQIKELVIKNDPDPRFKPLRLSKNEALKYNVKMIGGNLSKEEYLNLVENCDIFFASRNFEGIGMSFLEPMTMGKIVIAPNHPTMNEYIINGQNGFLYSSLMARKINLKNLDQIGAEARESMEDGYKKWLFESKKIHSFIEKKYNSRTVNKNKIKIFRIIYFPTIIAKKIYDKLVNR